MFLHFPDGIIAQVPKHLVMVSGCYAPYACEGELCTIQGFRFESPCSVPMWIRFFRIPALFLDYPSGHEGDGSKKESFIWACFCIFRMESLTKCQEHLVMLPVPVMVNCAHTEVRVQVPAYTCSIMCSAMCMFCSNNCYIDATNVTTIVEEKDVSPHVSMVCCSPSPFVSVPKKRDYDTQGSQVITDLSTN